MYYFYWIDRLKLHHRRPQTVGGFKKCFGEQGQRHEIAATGLMKISAKSATDHFVYVSMCMCVYVYIGMHAYYKSIHEEACFPPWKQEKIIEVPQVQVVEKIVEVPQKQAGAQPTA